jgi:hypothetical protein
MMQENLQNIMLKMKNVYENVKIIQDKNEKMNSDIDSMIKKEPELAFSEKKTKIQPIVYVF